jgi:GNAT superfamily N-acetyltransferase
MLKLYKIIIPFILIICTKGFAGDATTLIHETLQVANTQLFSPNSIEVKLLQDCQETIPVLAQWIYDEWHTYDTTLTLEKAHSGFNKYLNDDAMPFLIVALKEGRPIGMISLKALGEPEFADLLDNNPWLSSFHVAPEERNKGLGQAMANILLSIAQRLGYTKVHFYTSNPDNVPRYVKKGAEVVEKRPFRGHTVTIMEMNISKLDAHGQSHK